MCDEEGLCDVEGRGHRNGRRMYKLLSAPGNQGAQQQASV